MVVGSNFDESHVPILNRLMSKMLVNVDVLVALSSADDKVSPFDARRVVLIDWGVFVWFEPMLWSKLKRFIISIAISEAA